MFSRPLSALVSLLVLSATTNAIPAYQSLAGLSERDLNDAIQRLQWREPTPPPGPPEFLGTKLVHDKKHPFKHPGPTDLRGPCPGLNTLANHGYIPRNGIATPAQIIHGVQEGYNMENALSKFTTYAAFLVDGNIVTDLVSIGDKTLRTGIPPPPPAIVAGMNNHGTFEGDASLTRGDAYFGDNHSFHPELFEQFKEFSRIYGNGFFNITVAGKLRAHRVQQSIETNPEFSFMGLRHLTAFGEAAFPSVLFTDGRKTGAEKDQLDMETAESFAKDNRMPDGFHRAAQPVTVQAAFDVLALAPVPPGRNVAGVNTWTVDYSLGGVCLDPGACFCDWYTKFITITLKNLYPKPTGVLRKNLNKNIGFLYDAIGDPSCPRLYPYGRD